MLEITPPQIDFTYRPSVSYDAYRTAALEEMDLQLRGDAADPLSVALLDLHQPLPPSVNETGIIHGNGNTIEQYCAGCAPDDDNDERPVQRTVWPCRTIKTLAEANGVPFPMTFGAWDRHYDLLQEHLGAIVGHLATIVEHNSLTFLVDGDGIELALTEEMRLRLSRITGATRQVFTATGKIDKELPF